MRAPLRHPLLKALWVLNRAAWRPDGEELSRVLGIPKASLDALVDDLVDNGLAERDSESRVHLTRTGRKELTIVLTAGTFDILHGGHVFTLERAKDYGDVLAVVIARDANVRKIKGRDPIIDEQERVTLVSALKPVDLAVLGDIDDPIHPLLDIEPDVVVLGFNQPKDEEELRRALKEHGLSPKIVRFSEYRDDPGSSSAILREVIRRYLEGELAPVLDNDGPENV